MPSKFHYATSTGLLRLNPNQKWIKDNLQYEVIMGSFAYGVSQNTSDYDIYGWCIPPKHIVFPHTAGYISGFGPGPQGFDQFQQHHVTDSNRKVEYDFAIYSVVKYLDLVAENNPNMIDSLFVPINCITHITPAAQIIRDARRRLLHKGAYHKFKGYSFSQIHKVKTKDANQRPAVKNALQWTAKLGLSRSYTLTELQNEIKRRNLERYL